MWAGDGTCAMATRGMVTGWGAGALSAVSFHLPVEILAHAELLQIRLLRYWAGEGGGTWASNRPDAGARLGSAGEGSARAHTRRVRKCVLTGGARGRANASRR